MSLLKDISMSVQQVAEAIGIAVGVEVEIVDDDLTVIGGTGEYAKRIGGQEEFGHTDGNYLYARVLRNGVTRFIEDVQREKFYYPKEERGNELAEICTPIKTADKTIGVIGLIAFTEEQKQILLDKERKMTTFAEKMSELLAAKAEQREALEVAELSRKEFETMLELTHEGIFAIDKTGHITHYNNTALKLFNTTNEEARGAHISFFMPNTPAIQVINTGVEYTENEEIYEHNAEHVHIVVTTRVIRSGNEITGVVLSFRDISEVQKLVYNLSNRNIKYTFDDIIGNSESIKKAKKQALITAKGNSTVLITGESGTGKEMFAKAIHYASDRASQPFITVNCGAIPENLLEIELFGYVSGAFQGANGNGKLGKFEAANGGTIFLDEVGDMPPHLQVKILQVLQNKRFERVGSEEPVIIDVRVIAATNKDIEKMIQEGTFREDLYYRLSVIPLWIPPLRERREDIRLLMYHFLKKYNNFMNRKLVEFSKEVESIYMNYEWPGNVRELENAIEYGTNMAFGDTIGVEDVPMRLTRPDENVIRLQDSDLSLSEQVKKYEREIIIRKLKKYGVSGNAKDTVAKELGLSRATLYRKLTELEIN